MNKEHTIALFKEFSKCRNGETAASLLYALKHDCDSIIIFGSDDERKLFKAYIQAEGFPVTNDFGGRLLLLGSMTMSNLAKNANIFLHYSCYTVIASLLSE